MDTKRKQREIIKARLGLLDSCDIASFSRKMGEMFVESELFTKSNVIMAYMAMPLEADPSFILQAALDGGKIAVVPVIDMKTKLIIPARLRSLTGGLIKDSYGILEPENIEIVDINIIDVIIVPGLGFDAKGNRLGRGGGFYDRFMDSSPNANRCGFALSCQLLPEIVVDELDQPLDRLLTEQNWHKF